MDKNHLAACTWASWETTPVFPFFAKVEPKPAPVLGEKEELLHYLKQKKSSGRVSFLHSFSFSFLFQKILIMAKQFANQVPANRREEGAC